jgi:hypothetical protein
VGLADGMVEVRNMQNPGFLTNIQAHTGAVLALDFLGASRIVGANRAFKQVFLGQIGKNVPGWA